MLANPFVVENSTAISKYEVCHKYFSFINTEVLIVEMKMTHFSSSEGETRSFVRTNYVYFLTRMFFAIVGV